MGARLLPEACGIANIALWQVICLKPLLPVQCTQWLLRGCNKIFIFTFTTDLHNEYAALSHNQTFNPVDMLVKYMAKVQEQLHFKQPEHWSHQPIHTTCCVFCLWSLQEPEMISLATGLKTTGQLIVSACERHPRRIFSSSVSCHLCLDCCSI
jgi:hypothetical protein